jgi:hypothetical protein
MAAIRILRAVHKMSFDDAKFTVDYARETGFAEWDGVAVQYDNGKARFYVY